MTTPDPLTFQTRLQEFIDAGAQAVALEVSSHALDQARVDGVDFDVAIFTNLTRDHLDYHQTMDHYFASKARLFTELLVQSRKSAKFGVIHFDDPWGEKLSKQASSVEVLTFGRRPGARYQYEILQHGFEGARFSIRDTATAEVPASEFSIQMPGLHNVQNAVSAVLAARALGIADRAIREALGALKGVAGRLERVPNDQGLNVFVDYAHTDDALRSILRSLDAIRQESGQTARLITVFGCGGDRDKGKRPMMCRAALDHSDLVVVTSDNPRSEDPDAIIDDIFAGARNEERDKMERCVDRRQAIQLAISLAKPGDVVLIAGKGHEKTQTIGDRVFEFSDVSVTEQILRGDT
ncbi:MAG: UDP-N-acetylmuramoyl-L-alanyl-D-glutamate--2,6-diaminopimelate ligase [Bdellovibrionaceae bacterium]|nr:UDP-N-acetylmuramoyl-L-alanyl-D-glutamate--2,6-diaminopimelate ligase [Pseudobdellovibrionaceae bacterium]